MALDQRRLIRPGKKSGRIFCVRQVYFTNSCHHRNLGGCKPTFHTILNITSEVKQYYEVLFLSYRPRTECSISQFCNTKCTHSIFRTIDRSTSGLLAKQLKKNPKSPSIYMASRFSLLQSELRSCLNEH